MPIRRLIARLLGRREQPKKRPNLPLVADAGARVNILPNKAARVRQGAAKLGAPGKRVNLSAEDAAAFRKRALLKK